MNVLSLRNAPLASLSDRAVTVERKQNWSTRERKANDLRRSCRNDNGDVLLLSVSTVELEDTVAEHLIRDGLFSS